jgi:hypothetical protein
VRRWHGGDSEWIWWRWYLGAPRLERGELESAVLLTAAYCPRARGGAISWSLNSELRKSIPRVSASYFAAGRLSYFRESLILIIVLERCCEPEYLHFPHITPPMSRNYHDPCACHWKSLMQLRVCDQQIQLTGTNVSNQTHPGLFCICYGLTYRRRCVEGRAGRGAQKHDTNKLHHDHTYLLRVSIKNWHHHFTKAPN